ncbi:glycine cleavage system aminomethyltransferase GcvT [bacterium]|nr:glycine cleavage system aminomethyltransferase GcvT [bacterium]
MMELKRTPFYSLIKEIGGKFVPFAGWEMPIKFTSDVEEHKWVRSEAGVFDVSHMGEITIKGKDALKQVNYLITNDASILKDGEILYTPMMNHNGGTVDDLLVYRVSEESFFLVVNASNIDKDYQWMVDNNIYDTTIENVSDFYAQLAVQGPKAEIITQQLFNENLSEIKFFNFKYLNFNGESILISRTGYTGEDGFEIYLSPKIAVEFWRELFSKGESLGLKPIGLAARDTLRLEKKMALYGHELSDTISPLEASLSWCVKMGKSEFVGKNYLLKQKESLSRKLVGIELVDKGVPRHQNEITLEDGTEIGFVTSGTMSPSLQKPIALALINSEYAKIGTEIWLKNNQKLKKGKVIKTPFL